MIDQQERSAKKLYNIEMQENRGYALEHQNIVESLT